MYLNSFPDLLSKFDAVRIKFNGLDKLLVSQFRYLSPVHTEFVELRRVALTRVYVTTITTFGHYMTLPGT